MCVLLCAPILLFFCFVFVLTSPTDDKRDQGGCESLNDKTDWKENTTDTTIAFSLAAIVSLQAASKQLQHWGQRVSQSCQ